MRILGRLFLAATTFFVFSSAQAADWVLLGETAHIKTYLDITSYKKVDKYRQVWSLQDFDQVNSGALSYAFLSEIDCRRRRERVLSRSSHSGRHKGGELILQVDEPTSWQRPAPRTFSAAIVEEVCSWR